MKTKTCPECEGIMDASFNCDSKPVWNCRCCWIELPRRINNSKKRNERKAKLEKLFAEFGF